MRKLGEVDEVLDRDAVHDVPVDRFVAVDRDVSEADGFLHAAGERFGHYAGLRQQVEGLPHGFRRRHRPTGQDVRADIHAELNGAAEIQHDDVLQIAISGQRLRVCGALLLDALQTVAQRLELAFHHCPIHAALLSARILSW